jgi:phosphatidylglycerophosphate synthase
VDRTLPHSDVAVNAAPWTFEAALKDATVEESVNLHVHRRLAFWMIRPLQGRFEGFTPNHITLISGALGVLSGWSAYRSVEHGSAWLALGALLLMLSAVVDCADGMLARLRGQSSQFGMLLDGVMDLVTGVSAWYGICYAICAEIELPGEWWYCAFALLSVVVHCALYDQIKGKFVARTTPAVTAPAKKAEPKGFERWVGAIYQGVYGSIMRTFSSEAATATLNDPAAARRHLTPAMRSASYLGLGTQLCVLYVAALLGSLTHVWITFVVAQLLLSVFFNAWIFVALAHWKRGETALRAEIEGA